MLDAPHRQILQQRLGARAWCYEVPGLRHADHGCEHFASMVAWAYWPSQENAYRPHSRADETASMAPAAFRALLDEFLGTRRTVSSSR